MKENETMTDLVQSNNTIGLHEFKTSTEQWKQVVAQNNGMLENVILAEHFDIPLSDLIHLVHETEAYNAKIVKEGSSVDEMVHKIRGFLGTKLYDEVENTYKMDLYLTGVNKDGKPIYFFDEHSAIYDFILACPPTCQEVSVATTE